MIILMMIIIYCWCINRKVTWRRSGWSWVAVVLIIYWWQTPSKFSRLAHVIACQNNKSGTTGLSIRTLIWVWSTGYWRHDRKKLTQFQLNNVHNEVCALWFDVGTLKFVSLLQKLTTLVLIATTWTSRCIVNVMALLHSCCHFKSPYNTVSVMGGCGAYYYPENECQSCSKRGGSFWVRPSLLIGILNLKTSIMTP